MLPPINYARIIKDCSKRDVLFLDSIDNLDEIIRLLMNKEADHTVLVLDFLSLPEASQLQCLETIKACARNMQIPPIQILITEQHYLGLGDSIKRRIIDMDFVKVDANSVLMEEGTTLFESVTSDEDAWISLSLIHI